ncbi:MAG TPA: hypothetical protein PK668_25625 [Myxococcota bacterium]|nr:hypothetical protein [Myxococcota bacterium]HRY96908.1 hypothetical protein [Myxococcota bacterium]HSA22714.1 hypothetical protein [Myxococcota bacterium]
MATVPVPNPAHLQHLEGLGPLQSVHRGKVTSALGFAAGLIFSLGLGGTCLVVGVQGDEPKTQLIGLGAGALLLVAAGFMGWMIRWTLQTTLYICEQGVCLVRGARAERRSWLEIRAVKVLFERAAKGFMGLGGEYKKVSRLDLVGLDGRELTLMTALQDFPGILRALQAHGLLGEEYKP